LNDRPLISLSMNDGAEQDRDAADVHDPIEHPEIYDGVIWRRSIAFFIDLFILGCLFALALLTTCVLAIVSLGLVSLGVLLAIPVLGVLYDTICIGGRRSATPGMRVMGIEVMGWGNRKPDYWQSFLSSVLFWATVPPTSFLVLLIAFFDVRSRCLHDLLAGTFALRTG